MLNCISVEACGDMSITGSILTYYWDKIFPPQDDDSWKDFNTQVSIKSVISDNVDLNHDIRIACTIVRGQLSIVFEPGAFDGQIVTQK